METVREFNPLDHPMCLQSPQYLGGPSTWLGHIPFAMAVIDMARPKVFVELGTHYGDSYFSFCQAVRTLHLPTKCFAVDTWRGDVHVPYDDGDAIFGRLGQMQEPLYGGFSTLIRATFDEAAAKFADGSVDLLHIDGTHTYEAVKHDFETWLPKLSDAGVVLLHDTQVRDRGFGVYRLFAEIAGRYPTFEFVHWFGLGVVAVGRQTPAAVLEFLATANRQADDVRDYFAWLGENIHRQYAVQYLLSQLLVYQKSINQWKRRLGRWVDPASEDPQRVLSNYLEYGKGVARDIDAIVAERLSLTKL